jgi:hypothetical protein
VKSIDGFSFSGLSVLEMELYLNCDILDEAV